MLTGPGPSNTNAGWAHKRQTNRTQRNKTRPARQRGGPPPWQPCSRPPPNSSIGMACLTRYSILISACVNQRFLYSPVHTLWECKALVLKVSYSDFVVHVAVDIIGKSALRSAYIFARSLRGLFAEQRKHSLSCYEPGARGHVSKTPVTFFAWKQATSLHFADFVYSFTISNEISVYRHQPHP